MKTTKANNQYYNAEKIRVVITFWQLTGGEEKINSNYMYLYIQNVATET